MSREVKIETDTVRRVVDTSEGVILEVGPDSDVGGWVEIRTIDPKSASFFGNTRLVLNPEMARQVGAALIEAANEADERSSTGGSKP